MPKSAGSPRRLPGTDGLTRRQVLTYLGAAGALAGGAPLTAAAHPERPEARRGETSAHTLFFNFSHERDAATAQYFLLAGGQRHALDPIRNRTATLAEARLSNAFLRRIPDGAITHAVTGVVFDDNAVHLCYVLKDPDTTTGTWSMSSVFFQIPPTSILSAHALGANRLTDGSLPLTAKRHLYGLEPAATPWDSLEEAVLKDSTDHAHALIGVNPDLLSAEPGSAAHIHRTHIGPNVNTILLAQRLLAMGPATPQGGPTTPTPWATLMPLTDEHGQPFKNQKGQNQGLIQYHPAWHPDVAAVAGAGMRDVLGPVKNDERLGADVTGLDPSKLPAKLKGAIWRRHDGFTTVDQSPTAENPADDPVTATLRTQNVEAGFKCEGSAREVDGKVQATLTFTNWFARWLGIYLLFLDANDNPIDASNVSITTPPDYDPKDDRAKLVSEKAVFVLLLGPAFTLMGIPVAPAFATITFDVDVTKVSNIQIFASGPNVRPNPSPDPNDPTTWGNPVPGWIATALVNYGVTMLLMAAGATPFLEPVTRVAVTLMSSLVVSAVDIVGDVFVNQDFSQPGVFAQVAAATGKALLTGLTGVAIRQLLTAAVEAMTAAALEDAVPVAGQIAESIAVVAGVATLAETSIEIVLSPVSYVYELALTHDLPVTIHPDRSDKTFPATARYYKVTALFDNGGTPTVQTRDLGQGLSTLDVVFHSVPLGGQVNVSVGFYSSSDELVGKGTTGLVANTLDVNKPNKQPVIVIEEIKVPIQSNTIYVHSQKTTRDQSGLHRWVAGPAPTVKQTDISCEAGPGNLCDFRSITVRQGTSTAPGYVGYAWQGYSERKDECGSGQGQLDQLANLGARDAQSGYVVAPCSFPAGTRLSYSLLTHGSSNFYLDSNSNVVRRVQLDPTPVFDRPANKNAWGALNFASDALLLHPSGRFVSINHAISKIEILKIPAAPMHDDEARVKLLAGVHSGPGSRPGLIDTPRAAAVSPDGVILILETGDNNRLQAFDLGGNPVQFFKKQQSPYFLDLTDTAGGDTVYLDLAVEFTGYLYVLSFDQGTNDYRLDIYHPLQDGTHPISTTRDVNAAKLTVDFWRNVYTLNYEVLKPPGTSPPIAEPSVSLWLPSTP